MCIIIVWDMINLSWLMKKTDHKVIIFYPSPASGAVRCGCECHTLTQYVWGSKMPPKAASSWYIKICVDCPFLEYSQHSLETCEVFNLEKEFIQRELTRGSLSTKSSDNDAPRADIWWDYTTYRMGPTPAFMVWLQSVLLNGHQWASQLIMNP